MYGSGREESRTKSSPSGRSAPTNRSSRHFSSGCEKPSAVSRMSSNGSDSSAILALPPRHLAAEVLEQADLLGSEVRAREQRPPLAEVAVGVRARERSDGEEPLPEKGEHRFLL